jgi:hypothetical protein
VRTPGRGCSARSSVRPADRGPPDGSRSPRGNRTHQCLPAVDDVESLAVRSRTLRPLCGPCRAASPRARTLRRAVAERVKFTK